MSTADHRHIARLEAQVLRQAADIGQLRDAVHRLTHENAVLRIERDEARTERDAARTELAQVRQSHADTKRQLGELVHALSRSDERLRALLRREFVASSERLIADDTYIPEIIAALQERDAEHVVLAPVAGSAASDAAAAAPASTADQRGRRRPANAGGRTSLPEDIERRHREYVPPADHPALRHAERFDTVGSTTIERWHVGKLDLHIDSIRCPIVRLTLPGGVTSRETLAPPAVIARGQVSDALLVASAVDKVVDHLPAYRQEQRALRLGVHIPRAKLCRWHIALAQFLVGVAEAVFDEIVQSPVIGIDDSVHRQQVPDRRVCKQTRIWAVTAPAGAYYLHTPTREGAWINDLLRQYRGGVMGDAYAGHNALLNRDDILALFCWAHVRRKFHESADPERRRIMLELIAELYAIESAIATLEPNRRVFLRVSRAKSVLARIKTQLDAWNNDPRVLPSSGIGRATSYARKLWSGLEAYVTIGAAPIDNNATERAMRRVAMHRKNSLFSVSDAGAEAYATLLTLTQTALMHQIEPVAYLNDIIDDIHFSRRPVSALTPQAYARRKKSAGQERS